MNSVLEEIYSTILPSAPYIIAAYVLIWLVLLIYVVIKMYSLKKTQRKIDHLEEILEKKSL